MQECSKVWQEMPEKKRALYEKPSTSTRAKAGSTKKASSTKKGTVKKSTQKNDSAASNMHEKPLDYSYMTSGGTPSSMPRSVGGWGEDDSNDVSLLNYDQAARHAAVDDIFEGISSLSNSQVVEKLLSLQCRERAFQRICSDRDSSDDENRLYYVQSPSQAAEWLMFSDSDRNFASAVCFANLPGNRAERFASMSIVLPKQPTGFFNVSFETGVLDNVGRKTYQETCIFFTTSHKEAKIYATAILDNIKVTLSSRKDNLTSLEKLTRRLDA